jgi:serine O-acetyltransferase
MIKSKKDYYYFLEADRIGLGRIKKKNLIRGFLKMLFMPDYIWKFQILLRKVEFYNNKGQKNIFDKFFLLYYKYKFKKLSIKLGYSIPINCFGPGLSIAHIGTIVINNGAKIGNNCRIHIDVNIGSEAGYAEKAPVIGSNVYIGPGVKMFGKIFIADGCAIGANAVVNKSIETPGSLIVGVPAKNIKPIDSGRLLIKATKILELGIQTREIEGKTSIEVLEKLKEYGY